MSRAIDSENLYKFLTDQCVNETGAFAKGVNKGLNIARSALRNEQIAPTLTPQNEPLTIEELQEMDREPVYIISEFYHISEWNIPNGIGEIVIAYDVPCAGMKSVIPSVEFIDGKNLSVEKYGSDWCAYRRPPEGEEDNG